MNGDWVVVEICLGMTYMRCDLLMFKVANVDFEWLYKIVELRKGIWVVTYEYERDVKCYKVKMILIYHLYPITIGGTKREVFGEHLQEMVWKDIAMLRATGNHT